MRYAALLTLVLAACGDAHSGCLIDTDCTGGDVCRDGVCVPSSEAGDLAQLKQTPQDLAGDDFALPGAPDGFTPDASSSCSFNNDGTIQRAEVPAMPGLGEFFDVNPAGGTVTVDVDEQNGGWDFSAVGASDQKIFEALNAPSGQWWASAFPNASYSQLVDEADQIYGVYQITDTQLLLLGLVSSTSDYPETEYAYATPIVVLQFPFTKGDSWSTTSMASGWADGVYINPLAPAVETWKTTVDETGSVKTPADSFPTTLRVRVDFSQTYGVTTTRIIYLWFTECYGAIARIQSQDNETSADFTTAAEYRRLAAP